MDCWKCEENFAEDSEIFCPSLIEGKVYLLIKEGLEASLDEDKLKVDESKETKQIHCHRCDFNVGKILLFGPGNQCAIAFDYDKVKISKKKQIRQEQRNTCKDPPVEHHVAQDSFKASDSGICLIKKKVIKDPVNFPQMHKETDFDWITLSLTKNPYDYQVQAFMEGLQKNIVVVLNTGAGKTLIASMILAKMCQLNPNRMGLMLVDKVPLASQQGDAIIDDTKLSVISLHGRNKTKNRMNKLNLGCYDALVVTAGAFNEMLLKEYVDVSLFCAVIFDECHHLSKKHLYVEIMKKFLSQELSHQPRIIGLTASPFSGEDNEEAEKNLKKFKKNFPNAEIYSPTLDLAHQRTRKELISLSQDQENFKKLVIDTINQQLIKFAIDFPLENNCLKMDLSNNGQIIGNLRKIQKDYPEKNNDKDFNYVLVLIDALEFSVYFGIPSACKFLKDKDCLENIPEEFHRVTDISQRLQKLSSYLKTVKEDSRILVFVDKRFMARFLTEWIQKNFPDLNAQAVVGHSGSEGMAWKTQQKASINKFAEGRSRLIVSTSVLEEGLDVAQCDLVVAFTGSRSLITFIQMRGRARKQDSVFVILETERQRETKKDVQKQEVVMRKVLETHHKSHFPDSAKQEEV